MRWTWSIPHFLWRRERKKSTNMGGGTGAMRPRSRPGVPPRPGFASRLARFLDSRKDRAWVISKDSLLKTRQKHAVCPRAPLGVLVARSGCGHGAEALTLHSSLRASAAAPGRRPIRMDAACDSTVLCDSCSAMPPPTQQSKMQTCPLPPGNQLYVGSYLGTKLLPLLAISVLCPTRFGSLIFPRPASSTDGMDPPPGQRALHQNAGQPAMPHCPSPWLDV